MKRYDRVKRCYTPLGTLFNPSATRMLDRATALTHVGSQTQAGSPCGAGSGASDPPDRRDLRRPHRDRGVGSRLARRSRWLRLLHCCSYRHHDLLRFPRCDDPPHPSSTPPSTMVTNIASPLRLYSRLAARRAIRPERMLISNATASASTAPERPLLLGVDQESRRDRRIFRIPLNRQGARWALHTDAPLVHQRDSSGEE